MMQDIILQFSWTESFAVLFSVLQVTLATKNNVHTYLFGIAGIVLGLYVMFIHKLYGEFILNIYYLVMSIYGWLYWKFGGQKKQAEITKLNLREVFIVWGIILVSFTIFYLFLSNYTDSDVPIWDSLVSGFAWAGMWLMAKRKIENWLYLNISNIICIPLMIHKGLYLYALLSAFLFVMAIVGYVKWKAIMAKQTAMQTKVS
ncbi:nicotinamide riboside transporter PnuC [Myroides sp. LJL119]